VETYYPSQYVLSIIDSLWNVGVLKYASEKDLPVVIGYKPMQSPERSTKKMFYKLFKV
jgi:hypothetical protein